MGQNTEAQDYKILLGRICAAMGTAGKKNAIDKFGERAANLEHTWEAYHFTNFIKEIFEVNHKGLMSDFHSLLIKQGIGAYTQGFRKRPSEKGFTEVTAKLLFKGVTKIRSIKDHKFTERDLLLEFLIFCQQPFISTNGTKPRVMSIFYGEELNSNTTIKQNDPVLIEKAQFRLSEEIEKLKKYSPDSEEATLESNEQYIHDQPVTIELTDEQIAFIHKIVQPLPSPTQKDFEEKVRRRDIQITELEALVLEQQKRIDELLNSDVITDEIKSLVEAGKINEAEARVDQIVVATVKEQQQKHGEYFYQQGKVKELKLKYKEAYKAFKQAVNCQPDNAEYLNIAGILGGKIADYEQAQQFSNKSLKLTTSELGEDHLNSARSYNNLAANLNAQGKYDEAEPLLRKSLDICERILGEDHPITATSYNNLAANLDDQGKYDEAEPLYRKGLDIRQRILSEDHPDTATSYNNLASNLDDQEKYDEAEPLYRKGLDIHRRILGENHPNTATSYNNLGYHVHAQGKYDEAEPLYHKGLDIRRRILGEEHPTTATSYNNVGSNVHAQGKYDEAEPWYRKGLDIRQRILGEDHPDTAASYNNLAMNLNAQGKYDEAEPLYHKGLDIRRRILGEEHPTTATSCNNLALNLNAQGKYDEAEPFYRKSYELLLKTLGEHHPTTRTVLKNWKK